jgi:hypothetical protein
MVLVISEPLKNQWFFIRFFDLFMHVFKPWLYIEPGSLDLACNFQPTVMYQTGSLGFLHNEKAHGYVPKPVFLGLLMPFFKATGIKQNRLLGTFVKIFKTTVIHQNSVLWTLTNGWKPRL